FYTIPRYFLEGTERYVREIPRDCVVVAPSDRLNAPGGTAAPFILPSIRLSIFSVAVIAAACWSASKPRVLNWRSSISQVMMVSTKASVRPPGGMDIL